MHRTRVDRDRAHHPRVAAARVCDALEAWEHVATRVRSYKLSKTQMTVTICFKFGGSDEVRSPLIFEHCASPTVDGRGPPWFGLEYN